MANPIAAQLYVPAFNPTGNAGEYSFESALFSNQAETSGNGAYDVVAGFVLYVPATSVSTGMLIPGVVHRYRVTAVTVADTQTLSGVMVWDEGGEEEDSPTNGAACIIAQATAGHRLGLLPADVLYPEMTAGTTLGALRVDTEHVLDKLGSGGGSSGGSVESYTFAPALEWVVQHNKGTRSYVESIKDAEGHRIFAEVKTLDDNSFKVVLTEAIAGSVDVEFGAPTPAT